MKNTSNLIRLDGRTDLEIVDELWAKATQEQKEKLLTNLGFDKSWAITKSVKELNTRGGSMVVRSLVMCFRKSQEKKGVSV